MVFYCVDLTSVYSIIDAKFVLTYAYASVYYFSSFVYKVVSFVCGNFIFLI